MIQSSTGPTSRCSLPSPYAYSCMEFYTGTCLIGVFPGQSRCTSEHRSRERRARLPVTAAPRRSHRCIPRYRTRLSDHDETVLHRVDTPGHVCYTTWVFWQDSAPHAGNEQPCYRVGFLAARSHMISMQVKA